jgi:hypothetical protein
MERVSARAGPDAGLGLAGEVVGHGLFCMSPGDVPALRRRPGPVPDGSSPVPPSLLRYSDEQTIAGTAAVFTAIAGMGVPPIGFEDWGVVAAPRYLGRAHLAVALRNFLREGVWGTSPHLIPHFALHSASGTISLALGMHGPNLGVGGGLYCALEGFLAALTWVSTGIAPGVWLVLSGWSPELVPDRDGGAPAAGQCQALAIALVSAGLSQGGALFRAAVGTGSARAVPLVDFIRLAAALERPDGPSRRAIVTDPRGRLRIELVRGREGVG